jgi:hydrogenase expression/formation protein HypD
VENEYTRCVSDEGNKKALRILDEVFEPVASKWRGFPLIPQSKMKLKDSYSEYDAEIAYETCLEDVHEVPEPKNCLCGDVLRGITYPQKCPLFGSSCTPDTPIGPCMVSIEGSCNIEYRYKND